MSWNVMFIGKPANLQAALESYAEKLTSPAKDEVIAAIPYITGILNLNNGQFPLKLHANGSSGSCNISIEYVQSTLV